MRGNLANITASSASATGENTKGTITWDRNELRLPPKWKFSEELTRDQNETKAMFLHQFSPHSELLFLATMFFLFFDSLMVDLDRFHVFMKKISYRSEHIRIGWAPEMSETGLRDYFSNRSYVNKNKDLYGYDLKSCRSDFVPVLFNQPLSKSP